jgi:hypothetical protein
MGSRDDVAAMQAAVYDYYGDPVIWPGLAAPVTVLRGAPERELNFGQSQALVTQNQFRVRVSEVAQPLRDGTFTGAPGSAFAGQTFSIADTPRLEDRLSVEWSFQALPVAP